MQWKKGSWMCFTRNILHTMPGHFDCTKSTLSIFRHIACTNTMSTLQHTSTLTGYTLQHYFYHAKMFFFFFFFFFFFIHHLSEISNIVFASFLAQNIANNYAYWFQVILTGYFKWCTKKKNTHTHTHTHTHPTHPHPQDIWNTTTQQ